MTPLDRVIQHVRAQGRAGTHQAVLLAEIDRLNALVADLREELMHAVSKETADV